jgi:hypothetical protein
VTEDIDLGSAAGDCGVGAVADDLRALYLHPPVEPVAQAHLRTMRAAVDALAGAPRPVDDLDARRRTRRRALGVAAGGFVLLSGGLAAAGELPPSIQQRVSSIVSPVGIHPPQGRGVADPRGPSIDPTVSLPARGPQSNDRQPPAPPGQGGVAPGESPNAPGNGGADPGRSEVAPDKDVTPRPTTTHPGDVEKDPDVTGGDGKDKTPKNDGPASTTTTTTAAAGPDEDATGTSGSAGTT